MLVSQQNGVLCEMKDNSFRPSGLGARIAQDGIATGYELTPEWWEFESRYGQDFFSSPRPPEPF
jgi:hypothetical protein